MGKEERIFDKYDPENMLGFANLYGMKFLTDPWLKETDPKDRYLNAYTMKTIYKLYTQDKNKLQEVFGSEIFPKLTISPVSIVEKLKKHKSDNISFEKIFLMRIDDLPEELSFNRILFAIMPLDVKPKQSIYILIGAWMSR